MTATVTVAYLTVIVSGHIARPIVLAHVIFPVTVGVDPRARGPWVRHGAVRVPNTPAPALAYLTVGVPLEVADGGVPVCINALVIVADALFATLGYA